MRRPSRDQVLMSAWLAGVWVLLWGSLQPLTLISAVVVGPLCLAASRLPALPMRTRPRWHRIPLSLARFARDLLTSSLQVAWTTVRRGPHTRSALLAIEVKTPSDVALTMVANRLSLEPGTLVVDIDRETDTLYFYRLDVQPHEDLDQIRQEAWLRVQDVLVTLGEETAT